MYYIFNPSQFIYFYVFSLHLTWLFKLGDLFILSDIVWVFYELGLVKDHHVSTRWALGKLYLLGRLRGSLFRELALG